MMDYRNLIRVVLAATLPAALALPASAAASSWTFAEPTLQNQTQSTPSSVRPASLQHDEYMVKIPCVDGKRRHDGSRVIDCYKIVKKATVVRPAPIVKRQAYRIVRPIIEVPVPMPVRVVRPVIEVPYAVSMPAPHFSCGQGQYGYGYGHSGPICGLR